MYGMILVLCSLSLVVSSLHVAYGKLGIPDFSHLQDLRGTLMKGFFKCQKLKKDGEKMSVKIRFPFHCKCRFECTFFFFLSTSYC